MKASKTSSKNISFIIDLMKDLSEKHDKCLELSTYSKELKKRDGEFYEVFYTLMREVNAALSTEV